MTDKEWAKKLTEEGYSLDEIIEAYVQVRLEQRARSEFSLVNLGVEPKNISK